MLLEETSLSLNQGDKADEYCEAEKKLHNERDFMDWKSQRQWEIVELILQSSNLEKYIEKFRDYNISLDTFLNLIDSDLETVGITDKAEKESLLRNLENHKTHTEDLIINENHFEDLIMVKNVLEQVELLQKYSNFVYLNWASQKLVDYDGDKPDPPSSYLKILLERSIVQCDRMCDLIFGENNPDHLIGTFLKVHNMPPPKYLSQKLVTRKKPQRKLLKGTGAFFGVVLLVMATIKFCRWHPK
ncbi:hypothetical protein RUM43_012950 [Polyplax serrata]|uniref:SAM domain-containing protein n=1 Tax=Polyplax serrata TaxID=468196 RepID=A0AAN8S747_POLSC